MKIYWKSNFNGRHKNTRGLSTLGYGRYYQSRSSLYNNKKIELRQVAPPEQNFQFFDDRLDFESLRCFGSTEGEGVEEEVSDTSRGYLQRPY